MPCAVLPPPAPVPWGEKKGGSSPWADPMGNEAEPNSSSRPRWLLGAVVDGVVAALSVPSYFDGKKLDSGGWEKRKKKGLGADLGGSEQVWGAQPRLSRPRYHPAGHGTESGEDLGLKTSG